MASGPLLFCVGGSVMLDGGSGYTSYLWNTGETSRTISVKGTKPGNYSYFLQVQGSTGTTLFSDTVVIHVIALPKQDADIHRIGDTLYIDSMEYTNYYFWNLNDSMIAGSNSRKQGIIGTGSYRAYFVNIVGCMGRSKEFIISPTVGVDDEEGKAILYTTGNELFLHYHAEQPSHIEVINLLGVPVLQQQVEQQGKVHQMLNCNTLSAGMYVARVRTNNTILCSKVFIKE